MESTNKNPAILHIHFVCAIQSVLLIFILSAGQIKHLLSFLSREP